MPETEARTAQQVEQAPSDIPLSSDNSLAELHKTVMDTVGILGIELDNPALIRGLIKFEGVYRQHSTPKFLNLLLGRMIKEEVDLDREKPQDPTDVFVA